MEISQTKKTKKKQKKIAICQNNISVVHLKENCKKKCQLYQQPFNLFCILQNFLSIAMLLSFRNVLGQTKSYARDWVTKGQTGSS